MNDFKIFFILGNPRSGTSLLRIILNNHPNIVVPPECGFIQWLCTRHGNFDGKGMSDVDNFIEDLRSLKKIETWNIDFNGLKDYINEKKPESYSHITALVIEYYGINLGKKIIWLGDKNNYYIDHLDLLLNLFPSAKFIEIVRDGRDVATSYQSLSRKGKKYEPNLSVDIKSIAKEWSTNLEKIQAFFQKIERSNKLTVKYEDLIIDPQIILNEICNLLKIEFNSEMLDYYKNPNFGEPLALLDWKIKTTKPLDASSIGKYKMQLSKDEIITFNLLVLSQLKQYGYE
jgi:hypothetical protein